MVTDELRGLISEGASSAAIERCAIAQGMQPLTLNALELAHTAETSLREVYRVRLS